MCMRRGNGQCIFTGNLISDNSFVAVTAESGQCRPFSSDPLEVSLSSSRCPGSFLVSNGVANRPGCTFCNGVTDQVVQIPSDGQGSSLGVRATPPEYLSIPGHEDCFGSYRSSSSLTLTCLPRTRPERCIPPVWDRILQVFDGDRCPSNLIVQDGRPEPTRVPFQTQNSGRNPVRQNSPFQNRRPFPANNQRRPPSSDSVIFSDA